MTDRWGTDGSISLPKPRERVDVVTIDMEGFCFTPDGIRINVSQAEHESLLRQGYGPQAGEGP